MQEDEEKKRGKIVSLAISKKIFAYFIYISMYKGKLEYNFKGIYIYICTDIRINVQKNHELLNLFCMSSRCIRRSIYRYLLFLLHKYFVVAVYSVREKC